MGIGARYVRAKNCMKELGVSIRELEDFREHIFANSGAENLIQRARNDGYEKRKGEGFAKHKCEGLRNTAIRKNFLRPDDLNLAALTLNPVPKSRPILAVSHRAKTDLAKETIPPPCYKC